MRMWDLPETIQCRKHLLGEHVEMHMFAGTIKKGISIQGYLKKGLVNPSKIKKRHDLLAKEMRSRGYQHNSPLISPKISLIKEIDKNYNLKDLIKRCPECRNRTFILILSIISILTKKKGI